MKPPRLSRLLLLSFCVWMAALSSPQAQTQDPTSESAKPLIYGIYPGHVEDFWRQAEQGARDAANSLGYRLVYRGAEELDIEAQQKIFDSALASGAKGIFIAPNSADRAKDVEKAEQSGVPVVYFDRTYNAAKIISFIGTDNYNAGKMAAEKMVDHFGDKGPVNVAVFRMSKDIFTTSERERGFIDAIKIAGYNVVIEPYITAEIGEARNHIMRLMADKDTPKFEAIFTPNEPTTIATILTLRFLKKTSNFVHIGFDGGEVIEKAIRSGELKGAIVQQPYRMGYYSVRTLDAHLKGNPVEPFVESGALYVTKDNVGSYTTLTRKVD